MDLNRVALFWDGGGFTASFSVGMRKATTQWGIRKPLLIQGVSAGAINGAKDVETEGDILAIEEAWLKIERDGAGKIFSYWEASHRGWKNSLFGDGGLHKLLGNIKFDALIRSPILFQAVVFNEIEQRQTVFSSRDPLLQQNPDRFHEIIRASASLRGFLPPVLIDGIPYSDGISLLIEPAIRAGCRTMVILLNEPPGQAKDTSNTLWMKRLLQGIHAAYRMMNEKEIRGAMDINESLLAIEESAAGWSFLRRWVVRNWKRRLGLKGKFPVDIVIIRPEREIPTLWTVGFEKGDIKKAIAHGYEVGMRTLEHAFRSDNNF